MMGSLSQGSRLEVSAGASGGSISGKMKPERNGFGCRRGVTDDD